MILPGRLPRTTSPTKLGPHSAAWMKFVISCAKPPRPKTTRNGKIFIEGFRDWIFEALVRRHESACHRRSNPKSVRNHRESHSAAAKKMQRGTALGARVRLATGAPANKS